MGLLLTCISLDDFSNDEMNRCEISVWEVILGAPDRVHIPCLMTHTLSKPTHLLCPNLFLFLMTYLGLGSLAFPHSGF